MNLFNIIRDKIIIVCSQIAMEENWHIPNMDNIATEQPKNANHGDIATNAAMILAGQVKHKPRDIAEKITHKLAEDELMEEINIAGPGFINITLKKDIWLKQLTAINNDAAKYAQTNIGEGKRANIEFVSANPTGPMHIGHARNAVCGDALANLMDFCGYKVTKEFYINDAGGQIDQLAKSVYLRYLELFGKFDGSFPINCYPGEYLIPPARKLKEKYGDSLLNMNEAQKNELIKPFIVKEMMDLIKQDLKLLGIEHEIFTSEKELHDEHAIDKVVKFLEEKQLVYRGILDAPKGKKPDDWEEREQLLFKTTKYGDDIDRPLQKSDGSWTYLAADIAYMKDKLDRNYDYLAIFLGADHGGYVKRLKAAAKALSDNKADIDVKICQLVNYLKNGQPLKMSKRSGNFSTVKDIVNAVGKDIIRFIMLTRKNDVPLDFDLDKVIEQSKDNPVFYVQYAHARAKSVIRNAKDQCPEAIKILQSGKVDLNLINTNSELSLIKNLSYFPRQIEQAALSHEPHRIAYYLETIASEFHSLWNKGKDEDIRFIIEHNPELTASRLLLVEAVSKIIASGLKLIGVQAVDSM